MKFKKQKIKKEITDSVPQGPAFLPPALIEPAKTEKEKLLELYDKVKALGIHSISDLENLIARAE